ncbi:MAG TPA: AsmA family protein, partial [Candidatus Binataceae bacterium]|nr:AsmA family protein [Candidatus Binataceae bacterium]
MRRLLLIAGGVIGIALLIVIAVVGYAYFNLNSIIAANRARLLSRASAAIGRPLEAGEIKASLGRGTAIEVSGVKLADDASFSQLPFIEADDVLLKVQLLPLLHKEIKVTELVLKQPQIRIIRDASGAMNLSSIAKKGSREPGGLGGGIETLPSGEGGGAATVSNLTIETLTIEDGRIFYLDRQAGGTPVNINAVNLSITHFSPTNPFDVTLDLAAFGTTKNLTVSGTAGPIMKDGAVDTGAIPINLDATVGPLTLAQLRAIPALAGALPRALIISDEVNLEAKIAGTVDAISFDLASNLSGNRVAYAPSFDKPAGTALKFAASGGRTAERVFVQQANLTLADLRAKLSNIAFSAGGLSARIDSNRFDLRPIAQLITPAQRYNPTGSAEIHSGLHFAHSKPDLNGIVTLANVNLAMPEGNAPPVSDFNGTIHLAGTAANIGPLTFKLGSGNARLQVSADSLQPLHATYQLSVDKIAIAELVPSRKDQGDENLLQVAATGTVGNAGGAFGGSTKLGAASGVLANLPFTQLSLDAAFA